MEIIWNFTRILSNLNYFLVVEEEIVYLLNTMKDKIRLYPSGLIMNIYLHVSFKVRNSFQVLKKCHVLTIVQIKYIRRQYNRNLVNLLYLHEVALTVIVFVSILEVFDCRLGPEK